MRLTDACDFQTCSHERSFDISNYIESLLHNRDSHDNYNDCDNCNNDYNLDNYNNDNNNDERNLSLLKCEKQQRKKVNRVSSVDSFDEVYQKLHSRISLLSESDWICLENLFKIQLKYYKLTRRKSYRFFMCSDVEDWSVLTDNCGDLKNKFNKRIEEGIQTNAEPTHYVNNTINVVSSSSSLLPSSLQKTHSENHQIESIAAT